MNVYLRRGREQRVLGGHPWVFRSDIEREDGAADGLPVRVLTSAGRFLAMAVYNPRSQISLRILSRRDEPIDAAFIRGRVRRALDYRRRFADLNSCRLIFAESDGLPAVIADKFGDVIVLQILCLGMERFKGDIVDALAQELSPRGIHVLAVNPCPMDTPFLKIGNILGNSRAFARLPRCQPAKVAEVSLRRCEKGRGQYTPLLLFKVYRVLAKLLPHTLLMRISRV